MILKPERRDASPIENDGATEALLGLPSGALYTILSSQGVSLPTYYLLMDALVSAGKIKQRGDCYFAR